MKTVGAFEAKTHLAALLAQVSKGERITITKHGTPVATLVPPEGAARRDPQELIAELRRLRKGNKLGNLTIRGLIEEGRRS
jgi:prevent-host-death family protein